MKSQSKRKEIFQQLKGIMMIEIALRTWKKEAPTLRDGDSDEGGQVQGVLRWALEDKQKLITGVWEENSMQGNQDAVEEDQETEAEVPKRNWKVKDESIKTQAKVPATTHHGRVWRNWLPQSCLHFRETLWRRDKKGVRREETRPAEKAPKC